LSSMPGFAHLMYQRVLPLLAAASLLLLLALLFQNGEGMPSYWNSELLDDLLDWTGGVLLLAVLLRLCLRSRALLLFIICMLLYLASGLPTAAVLASLLFFLSALYYGRILLRLLCPREDYFSCGLSRPLLIGIALLLGFFSLLIQVPWNYPLIHALVLLAPLLLLVASGQYLVHWQRGLAALQACTTPIARLPYWPCAALLLLVAAICRYAFFPSLGADDNVLHLRMWTMLSWQHQYSFDVIGQVWEAAPFAVDLMHGSISLLAGTDARGALNLCLLALLARQMWAILRLSGLDPLACLLLLTLFISTPMTGNLLITLQTELFLAVLATSGVRLLLESRQTWYSSNSAALLAVAALSIATKLPGFALAALLLLVALLRLWPLRRQELCQQPLSAQLTLPLFLVVLAVLAFCPYFLAWRLTGNPVFPLYNGIFQSPLFDAYNFSDGRWTQGFSLASYWQVFFATSRFYESQDFVAGFQYLFLLPLALLALFCRMPRAYTVPLAIPLAGFGLLVFAASQYWRYLYPVLPLASCVLGALMLGRPRRAVWAALLGCLALNLWFYPGISWLLTFPPGESRSPAEKALFIRDYMPSQALSTHLNNIAPGARVLFHPDYPYGASLQGDPYYITWYAPSRLAVASRVKNTADLQAFIRDEKLGYAIWDMGAVPVPGDFTALFREYLQAYGLPLQQAGNQVLFQLQTLPLNWNAFFQADQLDASSEPTIIATLDPDGHSVARYQATFRCISEQGYFVAQINWDTGPPFYRLVPCSMEPVAFVETLPIPPDSRTAHVYITARDTDKVTVDTLSIETD